MFSANNICYNNCLALTQFQSKKCSALICFSLTTFSTNKNLSPALSFAWKRPSPAWYSYVLHIQSYTRIQASLTSWEAAYCGCGNSSPLRNPLVDGSGGNRMGCHAAPRVESIRSCNDRFRRCLL